MPRRGKHSKIGTAPAAGPSRWPLVLGLACILAATAVSYLPALRAGFTNYDDDLYVTDNRDLGRDAGPAIRAAFTTTYVGNFQPLTMLGYTAIHALAGLEPLPYHLANLGLHLANTVLVFVLIMMLAASGPAALLAAGLFALHPLHVESVAWVSQLKDVLYTFFLLAASVAYLRYKRTDAKQRWYGICLALFACSCLAKAMAAVFPLMLMAYDRIEGRQWDRRSILAKAPFFLVSIAVGIIAIAAQGHALHGSGGFPFYDRIVFAGYGLVFYLFRMLWPARLSAFYPYPVGAGKLLPPQFYAGMAAAVFLVWLFLWRWREHRMASGSAWLYVIGLLPVLQLVPVGDAVTADRYFYLSSIGVFLGLSWGAARLWERWRGSVRAQSIAVVSVLALASLGFVSHQRTRVWESGFTLFGDILDKYPNVPSAYNNLGTLYAHQGDTVRAAAMYTMALTLDPDLPASWYNRGNLWYSAGQWDSACACYTRSLALDRSYVRAYDNRGAVLNRLGRDREALADFERALELEHDNVRAWANAGGIYLNQGRLEQARNHFERAIALDPGFAKAYLGRGIVRFHDGDLDGAIADLSAYLRSDPASAIAHYYRGLSYKGKGLNTEAGADIERSARLGFHP
ncbi:MAG TPA: tetratricopeptide repeat protein [Candidatus Edwardsbacteria bacterium]|nr:tetratricopeptide repeat protein [Candidatus Edwardsbacteria bacterium]